MGDVAVVYLGELCTYRPYLGRSRYGDVCARPEADEGVHSWPDEPKRPGTHIWRHDSKAAPRRISRVVARRKPGPSSIRSRDWLRGYDSGYHAGIRREH